MGMSYRVAMCSLPSGSTYARMCFGSSSAALGSSSILRFVLRLVVRHCCLPAARLRLAVFLAHFGDVAHGLRIGRHVAVFRHRLLAGVVGRNRQPVVLERILRNFR